MPRTPEQVAADDTLTEAVQAVHDAYHGDDIKGILTDYVVVGKRIYFDDDGDRQEQICTHSRDAALTYSEILALLDYSQSRIRSEICCDYPEDA